MNLAEAIKKTREALLVAIQDEQRPSLETLKCFAELIELNDREWLKIPENDATSQKEAEFWFKKAKPLGWFRLCVEHGLLPENYIRWPKHNCFRPPKLKEAKKGSQSVQTVSGGAFEQNRRKH